jgi:hypothetical protein
MWLRVALLIACLALPGVALADAREQLHAAFVRFLAQPSFEARTTAHVSGRDIVAAREITSVVQFQAPDRYRITVPGRPPSVVIGTTIYLTVNGRTMKLPDAAAAIAGFRSPDLLAQVERTAHVDDLGLDATAGTPARKFRYRTGRTRGAPSSECVVWVSVASGLPVRLETGSIARSSAVTYSRYGDPTIRIAAPK